MTRSKQTTLSRKILLGLGAVIVSGMALTASAPAEAKSKFDIDIHFGGYGYGGWHSPCHWYLKKYFKTGHFHWKKKYNKCMWYYY